jgi:hypothetical protein
VNFFTFLKSSPSLLLLKCASSCQSPATSSGRFVKSLSSPSSDHFYNNLLAIIVIAFAHTDDDDGEKWGSWWKRDTPLKRRSASSISLNEPREKKKLLDDVRPPFRWKKGEQRQVHGNKGLNPTKKRPIVFLFFSHRKNKTNVERDSS